MPPTLVASVYGMNFKHLPELDWSFGYPMALATMFITGIAPYLYFKRARLAVAILGSVVPAKAGIQCGCSPSRTSGVRASGKVAAPIPCRRNAL